MHLNKLSDSKLIKEYKKIRSEFFKAELFSKTDEEISKMYGLIIKEIKKRSLETLSV